MHDFSINARANAEANAETNAGTNAEAEASPLDLHGEDPRCPECGWIDRPDGPPPSTRSYRVTRFGLLVLALFVVVVGGVLGRERGGIARITAMPTNALAAYPAGGLVWSDFVGPDRDANAGDPVLDWIEANVPVKTGHFEDPADIEVMFVAAEFSTHLDINSDAALASGRERSLPELEGEIARQRDAPDLNMDARALIELRRTNPAEAEQTIRNAIIDKTRTRTRREPQPDDRLAVRVIDRTEMRREAATHFRVAGAVEILRADVVERRRRGTAWNSGSTSPIPEIPAGVWIDRDGARFSLLVASGRSHRAYVSSAHAVPTVAIGLLLLAADRLGRWRTLARRRREHLRGVCAACGYTLGPSAEKSGSPDVSVNVVRRAA
ncbi:MAG: hypothetical protein AB8G96_15210 [Phycisphaerales bacterium]